ncbi:MAG: hypothetical protein HPY50_14365 [Firmicutes bacterium]|nr:hypothetical protein [Bacillota bacterium]
MKKGLQGLMVMVLAFSVLLTACGTKTELGGGREGGTVPAPTTASVPSVSKPAFTRDTFPKIDGSTATIPLSEAMAVSVLGMSGDEARKFIKHNTTHYAYVNLIEGRADIIFVTEPSAEELKIAKDANVELEVVPVVKEGFVFLVNSANPVSGLKTQQIQDIYQGRVKNWKEVGGADQEIIAYQREPNSGSQTLMEQTVMKGLKLTASPRNVVYGMDGLIDSIAKYDNSSGALGYSVYYYARTMYNKGTIKFLTIDGVAPDNKSISSGSYPFTSAYYAVFKKSTPPDAGSRKLLQWLLGAEGQKLAEDTGYVPVKGEAGP